MKQSIEQFVADLAALSPAMHAAREAAIDYWNPDEPPVTTVLAAMGEALVREGAPVEDDASRALFARIEQGMASDDVDLRTAVATGLIEGMVGSGTAAGNWDRIFRRFGPRSAAHAAAWA